MKKIFTFLALLLFTAGYSQDYYKVVLKSENYTINQEAYNEPETLFTLTENTVSVKPIGDMRLIKKAVSVKDTSVYFCEYQGKQVEVITVITIEKFKVTVRGENMKYVIESVPQDIGKTGEITLPNTAVANQ
ncbi:hypothetical protein [uncultured Flavobacterium sp.]|uniref:hypothetical protein n=1 Tax=uncultured Flavobacterium sp. TaxID=165435 RepID=UPI0025D9B233|nr:hypothetical protein [uncultured Flavobacterium sp.]